MKSNMHTTKKINNNILFKKYLITAFLLAASLSFAQYYPANDNYGNSNDSYYNNDNYYGDDYDYPEDYYYDYPTDYYPQSYYESYYNDYRNSIVSINWVQFFRKYRLSRYQIDQILYLNQQYPSFNSWDTYYGSNPDRWYYERFFALQNILGPRIFVVFQNNYYRGYSPVVYFQNYRKSYYVPRYHVQRQYKNVNIVKYRVDRNTYKDLRANNGLYNPNNRSNSNNGFRNNALSDTKTLTTNNNGFRNSVRSSDNQETRELKGTDNFREGSFRSGTNSNNISPIRTQPKIETGNEGGFRNGNSENVQPQRTQPKVERRENVGFRSGNSESKSTPRAETKEVKTENRTSTRGGSFR